MSSKSALICVVILVFISTSHVVHGIGVSLQLQGILACSATGNLPGNGIPGVPVNILPVGGNTTLATVVTGPGGNISATISPPQVVSNILASLLEGIVAVVNLPIVNANVNCPALPTAGILVAPITLVATTNRIIGELVILLQMGGFTLM
ncbi:uncharacterized protein [Solanum tuberosum]|uniref:Uncharacterized protein n=1 Tax=Solanum tuberosum TaxID=4113 RepID=M1C908_SOLTU|nr:PREDICTED: uncharacterized protein LOC102590516 [Solanum tuberosum]